MKSNIDMLLCTSFQPKITIRKIHCLDMHYTIWLYVRNVHYKFIYWFLVQLLKHFSKESNSGYKNLGYSTYNDNMVYTSKCCCLGEINSDSYFKLYIMSSRTHPITYVFAVITLKLQSVWCVFRKLFDVSFSFEHFKRFINC